MSRRNCLTTLAAAFALASPAASLAQSSSQAQYQGVAPETQSPVSGDGGAGSAGSTGSAGGNAAGASGAKTGAGGGANGSSSATGNGGSTGTAAGSGAASASATPSASSDTTPFSGGDIALILVACAGLIGLGVLLRRTTRRDPAGA